MLKKERETTQETTVKFFVCVNKVSALTNKIII